MSEDSPILTRASRLTFLSSMHPRCGARSPLRQFLYPDIIQLIIRAWDGRWVMNHTSEDNQKTYSMTVHNGRAVRYESATVPDDLFRNVSRLSELPRKYFQTCGLLRQLGDVGADISPLKARLHLDKCYERNYPPPFGWYMERYMTSAGDWDWFFFVVTSPDNNFCSSFVMDMEWDDDDFSVYFGVRMLYTNHLGYCDQGQTITLHDELGVQERPEIMEDMPMFCGETAKSSRDARDLVLVAKLTDSLGPWPDFMSSEVGEYDTIGTSSRCFTTGSAGGDTMVRRILNSIVLPVDT